MSVSSHDGSLGRSGLIIPENIPGDDLQPFRLEAVAGRVRQAGSLALQQAELAEATWSGLPGVLESPQGAVMYAALGTPSSLAATIEHKFDRVAYALEEFAAALRPIKNEFARIKEDAVAFRATIRWDERVWVSPAETHEYQFDAQASVTATRGYVRTADEVVEYLQGRGESTLVTGGRVKILAHWTQSSEHIDANNALMDRLADAYARLQNVEADCADAINRQRELCMAEVQKIEAWQLKQSGENTVVLPWGSRVDEDRNCGESFWWGVGNAGKEAGVGFLGLFGYNGVRNDWTPEQAGQSWLGAVQGIGALLVLTCPPLVLLGKAGVPVLSDATDMGDAMLKGLIAYDTWAENPAEAAGRVLVNVGSLFIPGAGEVSAAIKALTAGSRIVDAAGDAARLGDAALDGLNKVDNLTGVLDNVADSVGTGAKGDHLVSVGTKIDMPDSNVLHVGTKAPDPTPPASVLDDGPSGPAPHTYEPTSAPPRAGDDLPPVRSDADAPPVRSDADAPPVRSDTDAPPVRADEDAPLPGRGDEDTPPPRGDDNPPPASGHDDPAPPRSDDSPPSRPAVHPDDPGYEPRMDPAKGNNPDGTWDGKPGHHLDADDNSAVQKYAAESIAIEQRIRPDLERIVGEAAPGSRLTGLLDSVKYADSLKDKVADMLARRPDLFLDDALLQVKDSVRYTVESTVGDYTSTVIQTVERLRLEGYELVKFNDTWASPGYKGVNSSWVDPATGRVFEVQFHTAESFIRKTESHGDYELLRDATLSEAEIERITRMNEEWFADLEVPPGAGNLGSQLAPGRLPESME